MIMGGGFISVLQGYLAADHLLGIAYSYVVGIGCFLFLAYYGYKARVDLKKQGIDLDAISKSNTATNTISFVHL